MVLKSNRRRWAAIILFAVAIVQTSSCDVWGGPSYTVIVDPGHGGAPTPGYDDKWDPVTKKYLSPYLYGMRYGKYEEHMVMLDLARRVHHYLQLTETDKGWEEFRKILTQFSDQKEFTRVRFRSVMSREEGWQKKGLGADHPDVNVPFRLYDFPNRKNPKELMPGRLTYMNSEKPYLVVSLHMNPAGPGNDGGMAAVLAPGYSTFDKIRRIHLNEGSREEFDALPWSDYWLINQPGWNRMEIAIADTWVYFHGFWVKKNMKEPWLEKNRGLRHNMIQWIYRDPDDWVEKARKGGPGPYSMKYSEFRAEGPFWEREKEAPEHWRREAKVPGTSINYGGDNHYASDELMRFVQYGSRKLDRKLGEQGKKAIPEIVDPFVSTYSLPTLVNAVVAYLEIGHLDVKKDRLFILNNKDVIAKSLAVGVYSLFAGLELKPYDGPFRPASKPLDFKKYEEYEKGNYFEIVTE
ncbi:MAG: N-acetylmuramoyl-L-alanine amidase [Spirochaetaceae bacterium]|nr:N-acetylmuramoyl-L-alanine amidase [Spirochaetaceae bacterium]|tara:strand:+ start:377673 stop:379064 length:1392 start_codon:yes stop_codon:yes gene_type:complete